MVTCSLDVKEKVMGKKKSLFGSKRITITKSNPPHPRRGILTYQVPDPSISKNNNVIYA